MQSGRTICEDICYSRLPIIYTANYYCSLYIRKDKTSLLTFIIFFEDRNAFSQRIKTHWFLFFYLILNIEHTLFIFINKQQIKYFKSKTN